MRTAAAGIGTATLGGGALLAASGGGAAVEGELTLDGVSVSDDAGTLQYVDLAYWKRFVWDGFDTPVAAFDLTIEMDVGGDGFATTVYETTGETLADPANSSNSSDKYVTTDFFGDSDYHTGPGTSGTIGLGVGDAVDPDAPSGVSAQDASKRWTVIEGSDYSGTDPGAGYGLPQAVYVDDGSVFDAPTDGNSNSVDVTYRATFTLYDANSNPLTGDDGGDSDTAPFIPDPVLEDTFTVTVSNVESTNTVNGDGGAGGA